MTEPGGNGTSRVARPVWVAAGLVAVGVGGVGVVVPGLPSTGFFVLAAWCFSRSSPRLERWVLNLPTVGPMVADYRAGLGMPARAKVLAISMMWAAVALSAFTLRTRPAIAGVVVLVAVVGTWYLGWRVPTKAAPFPSPRGDSAPDTTDPEHRGA